MNHGTKMNDDHSSWLTSDHFGNEVMLQVFHKASQCHIIWRLIQSHIVSLISEHESFFKIQFWNKNLFNFKPSIWIIRGQMIWRNFDKSHFNHEKSFITATPLHLKRVFRNLSFTTTFRNAWKHQSSKAWMYFTVKPYWRINFKVRKVGLRDYQDEKGIRGSHHLQTLNS